MINDTFKPSHKLGLSRTYNYILPSSDKPQFLHKAGVAEIKLGQS